MAKKVTFTPKPPAPGQDTTASLDAWVTGSQPDQAGKPKGEQAARTKRFTLDVEEGLHRRIKAVCAARGAKMADELRRILEREFPA